MRQNQTINPFPQSRQIGKGGGILNTLYEIGYWNKIAISVRNEYILSLTFKTSEDQRLLALAPILLCHQDVGTVAVN